MSLIKVKSRGTDNVSGGRKNLVMNGAMKVSQRHGGSNGGTSTEGYKLTDRWKQTKDNTSATWNHTQSTDVPSGQGFAYSYKIAPGSADTSLASNCQVRLEQRWEGQDLQHLKKGTSSAESTTLSFWVKSVQTGTFVVNLQDTDNSRLIAKTYTVNTTNTWEKKVIHFAGDTTGALTNDNNLSMVLHFYLSAGSDYTSGTLATSWASITNANRAAGQTVDLASSTSNAFYLTGVQWEIGDAASDFEHLTFAEELHQCKRYYQQFGGSQGKVVCSVYPPSVQELAMNFKFSPQMRTTPSNDWSSDSTNLTYRYQGNNAQNFNRGSLNNDGTMGEVDEDGGNMWVSGWSHGISSAGAGEIRVSDNTTFFIKFDAEL